MKYQKKKTEVTMGATRACPKCNGGVMIPDGNGGYYCIKCGYSY